MHILSDHRRKGEAHLRGFPRFLDLLRDHISRSAWNHKEGGAA